MSSITRPLTGAHLSFDLADLIAELREHEKSVRSGRPGRTLVKAGALLFFGPGSSGPATPRTSGRWRTRRSCSRSRVRTRSPSVPDDVPIQEASG